MTPENGRGMLFPARKKSEKSPDFDGPITIEGTEYHEAAWHREEGLSVSINLKGDFKGETYRGVLTPSEKRSEKSPDLVGNVTIKGKTYRQAAWWRDGNKGLSVSIGLAEVPAAKQRDTRQDEIPF